MFTKQVPPRQAGPKTSSGTHSPKSLFNTGMSNDEIAKRLFVSPATAKTHVSRAMVKLGARDRAQVVVSAYESGLVRPGWRTMDAIERARNRNPGSFPSA